MLASAWRYHIGRGACALPERIADAVLDLQLGEMRVAKLFVHAVRANGDAGLGRDDLMPGDAADALVQQAGIAGVHALDHKRDARGQTRPQAHSLCHGRRAEERHAAVQRADATAAQALELVGKILLEPGQAAGEELVFIVCGRSHLDAFRGRWV